MTQVPRFAFPCFPVKILTRPRTSFYDELTSLNLLPPCSHLARGNTSQSENREQPETMNEPLIQTTHERGITTITINRPEKLNALGDNMRRDLAEAMEGAGRDERVRVVVLRGGGQSFCAGGDMDRVREMMDERLGSDEFTRWLGAARRVVMAMRSMPKPVLASISGIAAGSGFNLALACDMRVAAESAKFTQSFVRYGLHPEWGGTFFLPRIVPPNIACELFFLGDTLDAKEAHRLGIINRIFPDETLEEETQKLAERLRDAPPAAIAAVKQAVAQSASGAGLEEMLQYETDAQLRCFQTRDAREGVRAYVEKRAPRFSGR